jgi:hypothetical protein
VNAWGILVLAFFAAWLGLVVIVAVVDEVYGPHGLTMQQILWVRSDELALWLACSQVFIGVFFFLIAWIWLVVSGAVLAVVEGVV